MPPKITRVRWSAQNVPYGISFNERTGTFTGTPEDVGEYTVPVTVETNYGTDTKDMKIIVKAPAYNSYSIGEKALMWANGYNWNKSGAQIKDIKPDEDGFYETGSLPAAKLYEYTGGFIAKGANNRYSYGAGVNLIGIIGITNTEPVKYHDNPYKGSFSMSIVTPTASKITECVLTQTAPFVDPIGAEHKVYAFAMLSVNGNMLLGPQSANYAYYFDDEIYYPPEALEILGLSSGYTYGGHAVYDLENPQSWADFEIPALCLLSLPYKEKGTTVGWLSEDGETYGFITYEYKEHGTNRYIAHAKINIVNIGYRARKMFNTQLLPNADFHFLSEDNLLDNNPDNFTHGVIKNAWVNGSKAYVQTSTNRLYEYNSSSKSWSSIGTYDIKKLLFLNKEVESNFAADIVFSDAVPVLFLTNDGKLYHKGNALAEITSAHSNFTHIFPNQTFKDFTFGGNTLTVLKE